LILEPGAGAGHVIEEIELDDPKGDEVLVRIHAAGLCHTDDHVVTGDLAIGFKPLVGGHEGAGVVEAVGPLTTELAPGDHVVLTPIACGSCSECAAGHGNTCLLGPRTLSEGASLADGLYRRRRLAGEPVGAFAQVGAFAHHTVVSQASCVKVHEQVPLARAALVGCGVATGWGAAVHSAQTQPGDTVVVVGVGGVGINAVQGARAAGASTIVAVDPAAWKRELAPAFGATHAAAGIAEAAELLTQLTAGRMADRAILAIGVPSAETVRETVALTGRRAVTVITSVAPVGQPAALDLADLMLSEKQIRGSLLGGMDPRSAIPLLLQRCEDGELLLDELVSRTYALEEVDVGYADLKAGRVLRGQLALAA
jgi:S-(hydroxymethyl)glutathione dehydrogenase/alcohol dehydrogenase